MHNFRCIGDGCPLPFDLLTDLEALSLKDSIYGPLPLLPAALRSLCLSFTSMGDGVEFDDQEDAPGQLNLERLEDLEIQHWPFPRHWLCRLLDSCKSNLRRLALSDPEGGYPSIMYLFDAEVPPPLEILQVPPLWWISEGPSRGSDATFDDHDAEKLAERAPNLYELDLVQSKATSVGVKALVNKVGKPLRKLAFDDSERISSDAVTHARKNGIEVVVRRGLGWER